MVEGQPFLLDSRTSWIARGGGVGGLGRAPEHRSLRSGNRGVAAFAAARQATLAMRPRRDVAAAKPLETISQPAAVGLLVPVVGKAVHGRRLECGLDLRPCVTEAVTVGGGRCMAFGRKENCPLRRGRSTRGCRLWCAGLQAVLHGVAARRPAG